jgi:hypothetical protein
MDGTILQGSFIQPATAVAQYIPLRTGVTWMRVVNASAIDTPTAGEGFNYYWQLGMAQGAGTADTYVSVTGPGSGADRLVDYTAAITTGFYLYDSSIQTAGVQRVVTTCTAAAQPVVTVTVDPRLVMVDNVSVVRMEGLATGQSLSGIDFVVTAMDATHFTLPTLANAVAACGAGNYRIIPYNPIFYPRNRTVCNVSQAVNAIVTTTVPHNLTVGQKIRFNVPQYPILAGRTTGMAELNGLQATVLTVVGAIASQSIQFTIDIDTTGFTAFAWPLAADVPCQFPQMIPIGQAVQSPYENLLNGATLNTAEIGMILMPGALLPGGQAADTVYWMAGTSFGM